VSKCKSIISSSARDQTKSWQSAAKPNRNVVSICVYTYVYRPNPSGFVVGWKSRRNRKLQYFPTDTCELPTGFNFGPYSPQNAVFISRFRIFGRKWLRQRSLKASWQEVSVGTWIIRVLDGTPYIIFMLAVYGRSLIKPKSRERITLLTEYRRRTLWLAMAWISVHRWGLYTVSQKNNQHCFCHNFVKFPPILIFFGTKKAKTIELCNVYSSSTSPNLCQHTTV